MRTHHVSSRRTHFRSRGHSHRLRTRIHVHIAGSSVAHLSPSRRTSAASESAMAQPTPNPSTASPSATASPAVPPSSPAEGTSPDRYRQDDRGRPRSRESSAARHDRGARARAQRETKAGQADQEGRPALAARSRQISDFKEMRCLGSGVSNAHSGDTSRACAKCRGRQSLANIFRHRKRRRATRAAPARSRGRRARVAALIVTERRTARMRGQRPRPG